MGTERVYGSKISMPFWKIYDRGRDTVIDKNELLKASFSERNIRRWTAVTSPTSILIAYRQTACHNISQKDNACTSKGSITW